MTHEQRSSQHGPEPAALGHALRGGTRASIVAAFLGLMVGSLIGGSGWGAISGLALGLLFASLDKARKDVADLRHQIARLEHELAARGHGDTARRPSETLDEPATHAAPDHPLPSAAAATSSHPPAASTEPDSAPTQEPHGSASVPGSATPVSPTHHELTPQSFIARGIPIVRAFLFGGNTVVRVGVLVLLVGVSLLAKWASDHALFPIEARLGAAAGIGFGLAAVGYKLRELRPGFATTLQGGGIAALFLVVFSAMRIFELIPPPMAFILFITIALSGGLLAVLQRSQALIFIGTLGGFLAPIVASTGQGHHVVLFSYYLVLNLAIAAVAFRHAWRPLNLLAFVCTYGVATSWGVLEYRSENYASTQPFVLAYLVLFTGVAILYARRQPPKLRGLVDGTLVFGTALFTLLAQAKLVEGRQLGLALSAAGLGIFYAVLGRGLWNRDPEKMRRLCEAFAALAVGFGTMAIPFAIDEALTTAIAWSLEGAGLYWVGTKQHRRLPRMTGVALQLLAALAFALALSASDYDRDQFVVLMNGRFLSTTTLALAAAFMAWQAHKAQAVHPERGQVSHTEARNTQLLIAWSLLWWSGGCLHEIDQFAAQRLEPSVTVGVLALTALGLERAGRMLNWWPGRLATLAAIPASFLIIPAIWNTGQGLLENGGVIVWPLCLGAIYYVLEKLDEIGHPWVTRAHAPALWLLASIAFLGLGNLAARTLDLGGVLLIAFAGADRGIGAFARHPNVQLLSGAGPLVAVAWLVGVGMNVDLPGEFSPLPHIPLLNALDAALAVLTLAILRWITRVRGQAPERAKQSIMRFAAPAMLIFAFVWLNGILVRAVHHYAGVRFDADRLWNSTPLQVSLSITWSGVALGAMALSTRRSWRRPWMVAAGLLSGVVIKLFLVDLSQLSTGARIVTFLVVGVLLLVVGYLSPVPPAAIDAPSPHPPAHEDSDAEFEATRGRGPS